MSNTAILQSPQLIFSNQQNSTIKQQSHGGVGQDKIAISRDRRASVRPAAPSEVARSEKQSKNVYRSQNQSVLNEPTVPLTLHVRPITKDRLKQIAIREGLQTPEKEPLSLSSVGGRYLDRGMQEDMDMHYGALLEPVIQQILQKEMKAFRTLFQWLLVRIAFDGNHTRGVVANIFARWPGLTKEAKSTIMEQTAEAAKDNIFGKSPQIMELIRKFNMMMAEETVGDSQKGLRIQ